MQKENNFFPSFSHLLDLLEKEPLGPHIFPPSSALSSISLEGTHEFPRHDYEVCRLSCVAFASRGLGIDLNFTPILHLALSFSSLYRNAERWVREFDVFSKVDPTAPRVKTVSSGIGSRLCAQPN
jgi:hypothetical protein